MATYISGTEVPVADLHHSMGLTPAGLVAGRRSLGRALRLASHLMYGEVAVRGVDPTTGPSDAVLLHSHQIAKTLTPVIADIAAATERALQAVPDSIRAAVMHAGVLLSWGMAQVHGVRDGLAARLGAEVHISEAPSRSVPRGLPVAGCEISRRSHR